MAVDFELAKVNLIVKLLTPLFLFSRGALRRRVNWRGYLLWFRRARDRLVDAARTINTGSGDVLVFLVGKQHKQKKYHSQCTGDLPAQTLVSRFRRVWSVLRRRGRRWRG